MLKDKVLLITGAGRGIGRELAVKAAGQGAKLVLASRTYLELEALAQECRALGGEALPVAADITQPREVTALIAEATATYNRLDLVYHGAGVGVLSSALELKPADFDRMLDINLKGLLWLAQAAIPVMLEHGGGHLAVPVGILGRHVMRNSAGYSASKFAVVGLMKALAEEFNKRGMRFSMFYFGGVNTAFWDTIEMKVQRDKMLTPAAAAETVLYALNAPSSAIISEVVMQPDSHQFI